MSASKILIGCDPELFVEKDGKFQSAYGLVKGDKYKPFSVQRGAVQVDGMALEFNIDPAGSEDEFLINVNEVVRQLAEMVPEYRVMAVPVAHFDPDYIKAQPRKALELGCEPDYNAWSSMPNDRPDGNKNFRTGAGHIHIGWTNGADCGSENHLVMCETAVKQMDVFLGIPSVLFDPSTERREMYGRAGAYRPKPYGVEYRVLSNVWVGNANLQRWVYRATMAAMQALEAGRRVFEEVNDDIQRVINTSDVEAARRICNELGIEIPEV